MTTPESAPASTLRLRSYVVWSYVVLFVTAPFFALITLSRLDSALWDNWLGRSYMVSVCVLALLAATSSKRVLNYALDGTPPLPAWLLPLMGVISAQACVSAAMIDKRGISEFAVASTTVVLPLLMLGVCLSLLVSTRMNYLIATGVVVVGATHEAVQDMDMAATHFGMWVTRVVVVAVSIGFMSFGLAVSYQWTMSVLRGVDTQSKIDLMRADLAAAEERLRIARDLHDVFGRTLTAVAVKSELAAALAEAAGAQHAADESRRVRDLADEALKEVRSVLAEYRRPELSTELAGAHSLLSAAGTHVRLIGTDTLERLAADHERANEAFALVVREAGTNMVRHADAQRATFRLEEDGDTLVLTITNDGVTSPTQKTDDTPSSGLDSLAARLHAWHGSLNWQHKGNLFTVTARMPRHAHPDAQRTTDTHNRRPA